jgi:chromosomal replication initiator protein
MKYQLQRRFARTQAERTPLARLGFATARSSEFKRIIQHVSSHYKLSPQQIIKRCNRAKFTWPRHVCMYLSRETTGASMEVIGEAFQRTHGAVVYACQNVEGFMSIYPEIKTEVETLRQQLQERQSL